MAILTDPTAFDLEDFLPYLTNIAAEEQSQRFQRTYKGKYGMLRTEWRVLFHLGRYGEMTAKQICARARLHKTKVSRAVAALENKRFVTRKTDTEDRRHAVLSLTRKGTQVFDDLYQEAKRYNADLLAEMRPDEVQVLQKCLRRLAGFAE